MVNSGLWVESISSFLKFFETVKTLSKPPTINLFRYSSGDIWRYRVSPRALTWVVNGLAVAPP